MCKQGLRTTHTDMFPHTCTCVQTQAHRHTGVHTHTHTHTQTCSHTLAYKHKHADTQVHTHTHATHTCMCIQTQTHRCTHTRDTQRYTHAGLITLANMIHSPMNVLYTPDMKPTSVRNKPENLSLATSCRFEQSEMSSLNLDDPP